MRSTVRELVEEEGPVWCGSTRPKTNKNGGREQTQLESLKHEVDSEQSRLGLNTQLAIFGHGTKRPVNIHSIRVVYSYTSGR